MSHSHSCIHLLVHSFIPRPSNHAFFSAFVCIDRIQGRIQLILGAFIFLIGIVTAYKLISQIYECTEYVGARKKKKKRKENKSLQRKADFPFGRFLFLSVPPLTVLSFQEKTDGDLLDPIPPSNHIRTGPPLNPCRLIMSS
ncbi:uncharacterized protein BO88DRAFT_36581 [Aspergillus vadensis CBS 113365]|uniref:Uncharacterized protein n=1 Tax=Aspergillus vadensis (strain CBS 113365 / IMI 142717 / IBT 24658) TaxID=1448311 RepID=A0A319BUP6_ASPVC|nr:hypothetical protein BO88DRAFT_36581 [Aspergillus vadensis CBS 113365]PYH69583.1 hypothetical protein BO88DRAFT_36581 [Aspergillus vadensis CBS 113365]